MLATTSREKLAEWLSYPIGTKELSEQLVDVPMLDDIRLHFYVHRGKEEYGKLRSGEAVRILEIRYTPAAESFTVNNPVRWDLGVYAVASETRATAHRALIGIVMPKVRSWLLATRTEVWLQHWHDLSFTYDPLDDDVIVSEN